ncbi:MAG: IPT/TIG domain-containing protein [Vicinamibacterales bacterium]
MIPVCMPSRITGLLISSEAGELPVLLVRARSAENGALVAETYSAADGQFALTLPVSKAAGADWRLRIRVSVFDGTEAELSDTSVDVEPGKPIALTLAIADVGKLTPAYVPAIAPALVNHDAAVLLRHHVLDFIARGDLPEQAAAILEDALAPLEWAAGLATDATAALRGDPTAAARLRANLLGWTYAADDDEPLQTLDDSSPDLHQPAEPGVVNPDGLLPIALAAVHVGTTQAETQQMLDGLAAAVWSRPYVDLLYAAARAGTPAPMRMMMGGGVPGLPGVPGIPGVPGGKRPGVPGGPDWGNVPGKKLVPGIGASPTVVDIVARFRTPVNLPPSDRERCLVGAMVEVSLIKQRLPFYVIRSLDSADACGGELLTLSGEHFGASGLVVFPGVVQPVAAVQWSDTLIRVNVPAGAAPGKIRLSIFEQRLQRCGKDFDIYRLGDTLPEFTGGVPQILSLWVNGVQGDTSAEPESDVSIFYEVTDAGSVLSGVTITNPAGVQLFQSPILPGGVHTVTFRTPALVATPATPAGPLDLTVRLLTTGRCGPAQRTHTLTVTRQPDLRINQLEVTQAIQRLDNTVRLAASRRTMVRLYLTNGLNLFSYTGQSGELPGVTGSVTLWRGNQQLAVVSPTPAVITSRFYFQPAGRETPAVSLNFILPIEHLSGSIRLDMRVWLANPPHGVLPGPHTNDVKSLNVTFERTNHSRIVSVLLRDDFRGLPAPSAADFSTALAGARGRFPIPDDGFEIFLPPGGPVLGTKQDLTTEGGWDFVLEDLDTIAEDTAGPWNFAWCGIVAAQQANMPALKLNGIARPGNGKHDYFAMACQAGLPATFAHELAHVYGFGHAGCADSGIAFPENVDASLPRYIEETGIDLFAMPVATFQQGEGGAGDLMSYCGGQNRWTSIVLWHKLMDFLKI